MQFVTDGPDVPDRLLQAHEDGQVVFFCGAGISYPAGLPGFRDLVEQVYWRLKRLRDNTQAAAISAQQYDIAISLLEAETAGGRQAVRREIARVLTPQNQVTDTHEALLELGRTRRGRTRLVTTNFDRLFETAIAKNALGLKRFEAPLLPVPKNRWDGLVYLHGLLAESPDDANLDRLVVSSGDFGLAYLVERWAARFVSEMFRHGTVCFVGYSLGDPVLRYMTDALAADRVLGESAVDVFAFASHSFDGEEVTRVEWCAKNVTPILYRDDDRHRYLHDTLQAWAGQYRDGVTGKESLVARHAAANPTASTKEDDFVGRMLWALCHESGLPAKRFAEFNPVPSLAWLEQFCDRRFKPEDLRRFGIASGIQHEAMPPFSLLQRPCSHARAPWMAIALAHEQSSQWDDVMYNLANWLVRHLGDPQLLLWVASNGGRLHAEFGRLIQRRLDELLLLETDDLERIKSDAQRAIPGKELRFLWEMAVSGRLKCTHQDLRLYRWLGRLSRQGHLTAALRFEWRELIAPRLLLDRPVRLSERAARPNEQPLVRESISWKVVLAADDVRSALGAASSPAWQAALPHLLDDAQGALLDALSIMKELGDAGDLKDRSYWHLPSISEHPQNRGYDEWTPLIEIVRDAWMAMRGNDPDRAREVVRSWWQRPFPTFKRLALFGAVEAPMPVPHEWVDWLLCDGVQWLWSPYIRREMFRLLALRGPDLPPEYLARLEAGILAGPPGAPGEDADHAVWLRLAKMAQAEAPLGAEARHRLNELSARHSDWRLAEDERDEFPRWISSSTGWRRLVVPVPRQRDELRNWLRAQVLPDVDPVDDWREDDWAEVCRQNRAVATWALRSVSKDGVWPATQWREALAVWSDGKPLNIRRSWRCLASALERMPASVLQDIAYGVASWLEAVAGHWDCRHHAVFLQLCRNLLAQDYPDGTADGHPIAEATRHPTGKTTQALLQLWLGGGPGDGQRLPADLCEIFTPLCDTSNPKHRHARVVLCAHVIALFRVDERWTRAQLLPLFDWNDGVDTNAEARGAWEGFLFSPRLYRPLLVAIKSQFVAAARHYSELGVYRQNYTSFLTYAALDDECAFNEAELIQATHSLPSEALPDVVQVLVDSVESAGDRRADRWRNRVKPYLDSIWPKSRQASNLLAERLALLCVAAQDFFQEALTSVAPWLQRLATPNFVVHQLNKRGLCTRFPFDACRMLHTILHPDRFPPTELRLCLDAMEAVQPGIANERCFRELRELECRFNG
jgi:hypothetical protein